MNAPNVGKVSRKPMGMTHTDHPERFIASLLRPIGDHVLVTPIPEETRIGSFVIPDTAQDKPQRGTVVAVGEGRLDVHGVLRPILLKTGDKILFSKYAGNEFKNEGEPYIILSYDDILVILG